MYYAIAIDGPSASGKSTVAKLVAKKLNVLHLNTGALYRAIGLYAYENGLANDLDDNGIPILSGDEKLQIINNSDVKVKFIDGSQHTFLNGEDVTDKIYTATISDYSSRISAIPEVRDHILHLQRDVAKNNNVVMEGRDITSHVLPNAKYKFFVTASAEVRAKRRCEELLGKGEVANYDDILKDVKVRDLRDTTRTICPLIKVDDAIEIDTSNKTIEQVVDEVLSYIKE